MDCNLKHMESSPLAWKLWCIILGWIFSKISYTVHTKENFTFLSISLCLLLQQLWEFLRRGNKEARLSEISDAIFYIWLVLSSAIRREKTRCWKCTSSTSDSYCSFPLDRDKLMRLTSQASSLMPASYLKRGKELHCSVICSATWFWLYFVTIVNLGLLLLRKFWEKKILKLLFWDAF